MFALIGGCCIDPNQPYPRAGVGRQSITLRCFSKNTNADAAHRPVARRHIVTSCAEGLHSALAVSSTSSPSRQDADGVSPTHIRAQNQGTVRDRTESRATRHAGQRAASGKEVNRDAACVVGHETLKKTFLKVPS